MKKNFKYYALIWAVLFAAYQLVVFLFKPLIPGFIKYDAVFWISWSFIGITFIGNLVCAGLAFRTENLKKVFYSIPLITISWMVLVAMLVIGSILMLIPNFPAWIASIICFCILAFQMVSVITAAWAADTVGRVDDRIKTQTMFHKNAVLEVESLMSYAKTEEERKLYRQVCEALKYSDPMSSPELMEIENRIREMLKTLRNSAEQGTVSNGLVDELISEIDRRNRICRSLK